jgi:ribosomal protein L16/L10AE
MTETRAGAGTGAIEAGHADIVAKGAVRIKKGQGNETGASAEVEAVAIVVKNDMDIKHQG